MARIRSVHPSLFTDEAWVSCSPLARLLYIGLWTDADDQGVFEWKPLQIRMRLLPGDSADSAALLEELREAGLIGAFEHAGKRFGAIWQFRKYQRPKKPNAIHFLPHEWRSFVCLDDDSPEPDGDDAAQVPHQCPTSGENLPQMEDGGGKREERSEAIASSVGEVDFEKLWDAYPHVKGRSSRPKAKAAWEPIAATMQTRLPAAARRFAAQGVMPQNGPPALAKWLEEERWADWLDDAGLPGAPPMWNGPEDVLHAFAEAYGHEWTAAYVAPCAWQDVPERALIPVTAFAGAEIVRKARPILAKLGLQVLEKAA